MAFITSERRFRLKIIALMLKPAWIARYGSIILPDYFELVDEHHVVDAIRNFHIQYGRPPTDADDLHELLQGKYGDTVKSVFIGADEWDLQLAGDLTVQFCREQAAKLAVLNSMGDIADGDLASVVERMQQAMKVGTDLSNAGIDLKKDLLKWLAQARISKLPTGMLHLDMAMDGGLGRGELGIVLGPPNSGKSMALINIGCGIAGPIIKCNVMHFTLEMPEYVVAKRYAARLTFRFPERDNAKSGKYVDDFNDAAHMNLPGTVRIVRVSGTVLDLRNRIDVAIDSGFIPHVIIVDYGDELQPTRHRESAYAEMGDIFHDLRELGSPDQYDCPVWTASQAGRQALGKEVVTMKDLAESIKKAHVADAIPALCQTAEEERANQCRIFLAKLRDGESRAMIRAKYYKKSQAIITTGFVHS